MTDFSPILQRKGIQFSIVRRNYIVGERRPQALLPIELTLLPVNSSTLLWIYMLQIHGALRPPRSLRSTERQVPNN